MAPGGFCGSSTNAAASVPLAWGRRTLWKSSLEERCLNLSFFMMFLSFSTVTLLLLLFLEMFFSAKAQNNLMLEIYVCDAPDLFLGVMGQLCWFDWNQSDLYNWRLWLSVSAQSLAHGWKSVQKNLSQNMLSSCFIPHLSVTAAGDYVFLLSKMHNQGTEDWNNLFFCSHFQLVVLGKMFSWKCYLVLPTAISKLTIYLFFFSEGFFKKLTTNWNLMDY